MFFVVAILTKQFKVRPIQSYIAIVNVARCDILAMMYYIARRSAPLTQAALALVISVARSLPRFG